MLKGQKILIKEPVDLGRAAAEAGRPGVLAVGEPAVGESVIALKGDGYRLKDQDLGLVPAVGTLAWSKVELLRGAGLPRCVAGLVAFRVTMIGVEGGRGIGDIAWGNLEHAYGSVADVPGWWVAGLWDPSTAADCLGELYGSITHQGSRYSATSAAVPFLVEHALDWRVPDRTGIVGMVQFCAMGYVLTAWTGVPA